MSLHNKKTHKNEQCDFQIVKSVESESGLAFEKLLDDVGADGKFQKRLVFLFIIPLALISAFGATNTTLLLTTPEHSCHVPGRSSTNVTFEEWKNLTVPWEETMLEEMKRSSCQMFNSSGEHFTNLQSRSNLSWSEYSEQSIQACKYGWDFDTADWEETPATEFEWVCENKHIVTTMFSLSYTGNAIGTLLFSVLSDRYGRKPTFYVVLAINIICSIALTFVSTTRGFGIFKLLLALPFFSICQIPFIIVVELCSERLRTTTAMVAFIADICGSCLLSLFAYLSADWRIFIFVCHLPSIIFLFYFKVLPESPRWLLSQSRISECENILKKIASVNGREYTETSRKYLLEAQKEATNNYSLRDIFSSLALAKHLVLASSILSIGFIMYSGMLINIHNMTGNKVLKYLIFSLFEIPGRVVGSISSQYLGRRVSAVIFMASSSISCIIAAVFVADLWALTVFCALTKMFACSLILVVFVQIGELFPTQLRATAYGVTGMVGIAATILIPPIIAMGRSNVLIPYYTLFGIGMLGSILTTFLPETVGRPLPQTTKEAILIGRNQPYFSFIHKWNAHNYFENHVQKDEKTWL